MGKKKRTLPGINGTSCADIAFMLLLFFILTTSMDTDQGLARRLPQPQEKDRKVDVDAKINKRNILTINISSENRVMCAGEEVSLPQLREKAKEFIENPTNSENLPEKKLIDIAPFGPQYTTGEMHLISLQCDRGTNYQVYIDVQNELAAAYNELREPISLRYFNKPLKDLNEDEMKAISDLYPQKISEAEPKSYGDKTKK